MHIRYWIVDCLVGGIVGGIVGAIIAVNVVIYAGPDTGYESSVGDIFEHSLLLGIVVLAVLGAGPFVGILAARRARRTP